MKRKLLALALAVLMLVTMLPLATLAVSAEGNVAKIVHSDKTETGYDSLQAAADAVATGETIYLLQNITVTGTRLALKAGTYTIDGQGYSLSATTDYLFGMAWSASNVTVKNITLDFSTSSGMILRKDATLNLDNVTITGASASTSIFFHNNAAGKATVNIANTTFAAFTATMIAATDVIDFNFASTATVTGTFNLAGSGVVNIKGGTFNSNINVAGSVTATIDGASLDKITLVTNGKATITNTTFNFAGGRTPTDISDNGVLNLGEGVVMIPKGTMVGTQMIRFNSPTASANITGGTYTGNTGWMFGANSGADASGSNHVVINISGGTFTNGGAIISTMKGCEMNISCGTFNVTGATAFSLPANATVNVSGGTLINTNSEKLFDMGNGNITLNISGGYLKHVGTVGARSIQSSTGTPNTVNISGGVLDFSAEYTVNANGPHTIAITGGYFIARQYATAEGLKNPTSGFINLNGDKCTADLGGSLTLTNATFVTCGTNKLYSVYDPDPAKKKPFVVSANQTTPVMTEGASIRLVPDSNGIRFQSTFSKAMIDALPASATDVAYGTIILPTANVPADYALTFEGLNAAGLVKGTDYVVVNANEGKTTDEDGNVSIRAALVNIKNNEMAFSAVGFVSYKVDGTTHYLYTAYSATNNSRSMKQVAESALADSTIDWSAANRALLNTYAGK